MRINLLDIVSSNNRSANIALARFKGGVDEEAHLLFAEWVKNMIEVMRLAPVVICQGNLMVWVGWVMGVPMGFLNGENQL